MRHSPDICRTPCNTRRPGAGALSALVLLSLLMVSVDRLETSRAGGSVAVAAAAGARVWVMRAPAPVRPTRTLGGFRADNAIGSAEALTSEQVSGTGLGTLARSGLLDLPPPAGALA